MIRINLLPQRKTRTSEEGNKMVAIALASIAVVGALVYLLIHLPLEEEIGRQTAANKRLKAGIAELKKKTKDFEKLQSAFKAAEAQKEAIERLQEARSTPVYLLHELSRILTGDDPQMLPHVAERVKGDPNRQWTDGWDPRNLWINSFVEKGGRFTLKGSARSDTDIDEFTLRLQASMYFRGVVPQRGSEKRGKRGSSTYAFVITGKVRY